MITTKQPTDDMIEVAIVSMEEALVADGETIPEGRARSRAGRRCRPARPPPPSATQPDAPPTPPRCRRRSDRPADRGRAEPAEEPMTDALDAKLAELAHQYDEVQARARHRPRSSPTRTQIRRLGQRARPPGAGRRGATASSSDVASRARRRPRAARQRRRTTRCRTWPARRSRGSRPTRRAGRGPQGPAPAARPQRRPRRHRRDPGRRRRRGGGAVRRGAPAHVHPLRAARTASAPT